MAETSTTSAGEIGDDRIVFTEPDFTDQSHTHEEASPTHDIGSKSDDNETLALPDEASRKDSRKHSNTPSALERIRSVPRSAKKSIRLRDAAFEGPSRRMQPTSAKLNTRSRPNSRRPGEATADNVPASSADSVRDFEVMWRSRDNRKGSVAVPVSPRGGSITMRLVFSSKDLGKGLWRMFSTFKYWDISWWSGFSYSIGSMLFVIDGFWSWLPLVSPGHEYWGQEKYGVPLAFFFGALFYQLGAVMAYLEAINDGSFAGSAMKRLLLGHDREAQEILDKKLAAFVGHFKPGNHGKDERDEERDKAESQVDPEAGWRALDQPGSPIPNESRANETPPRRGGLDLGEPEEGETVEYMRWRWWPTWHRLRTHHIHEIGYLSCSIQLLGVTLYGVTSIVILPGILDSLNHWQTNVAYWIPQIVASTCFLIASFGFMFETQSRWWKPEFEVLGWWIGFWSIVGSVGFLLCATFGISSYTSTGDEYQSDLSTTWGSFAYLAGSMLQWYEAVNKHSVDEVFDNVNNSRLQPVRPGNPGQSHDIRETTGSSAQRPTPGSSRNPTKSAETTGSPPTVQNPEKIEQQLESKA